MEKSGLCFQAEGGREECKGSREEVRSLGIVPGFARAANDSAPVLAGGPRESSALAGEVSRCGTGGILPGVNRSTSEQSAGTVKAVQRGIEPSDDMLERPHRSLDQALGGPSFWSGCEGLTFEIQCDFLISLHVKTLSTFSIRELCGSAARLESSVLQLGVTLLQLLLVSPGDGQKMTCWVFDQLNCNSTSPARVRDVLPIPFPPVGAAIQLFRTMQASPLGLLELTQSSRGKKKGRQQLKRLRFEGACQVWRCLSVLMLNGLYGDWEFPKVSHRRCSQAREAAMKVINSWVVDFCKKPVEKYEMPVFSELVRNRSIDYEGEEVSHALPLRLEELLPGLPDVGVAGSLCAVEAAAGFIKDWVVNPSLALKPGSDWPQVNPRARINATRPEWYRVCGELFKRGIIEPIAFSDISCKWSTRTEWGLRSREEGQGWCRPVSGHQVDNESGPL